jgi:hypothetical protein
MHPGRERRVLILLRTAFLVFPSIPSMVRMQWALRLSFQPSLECQRLIGI